MVRKLWIVVALAVAGVALTPDTAEAGRRRNRRNCCPPPCCPAPCCPTSCCNPCATACNPCGGVVAPVTPPTAPPPVATPAK
jgi:hypothetical protein